MGVLHGGKVLWLVRGRRGKDICDSRKNIQFLEERDNELRGRINRRLYGKKVQDAKRETREKSPSKRRTMRDAGREMDIREGRKVIA